MIQIKQYIIKLVLTMMFLYSAPALAVIYNIDSCISNQAENNLKRSGISLPKVPHAAGNYKAYNKVGNVVYINQVALKNDIITYPGIIGSTVSELQAIEETRQTALNILSALKEATGGDLGRVKSVVQLTGYFNTTEHFVRHAIVMNAASDLMIDIFGERGIHTRATIGAKSLPLYSTVEIQAIFELCPDSNVLH
ncbi:RidA family protein [Enterobacter kobei]|uniref:RidA family protein n=1 Tax=Enterobacter kobei TaxID=208224 RepID=UPI001259274E|nr:RidA family protein [Enterobacter kobei]VAL19157.1 endoribonuclease L-PSP [Enterobacter kobei]